MPSQSSRESTEVFFSFYLCNPRQVERIEIPLLRYSLPIWMAHMNNAGMPKFSQYLTANLDNEHYDVSFKTYVFIFFSNGKIAAF